MTGNGNATDGKASPDGTGRIDDGARRAVSPIFPSRAYDRAAREAALDDGMMPEEIEQVLSGRDLVATFPVGWRESPSAYAIRAVAEMMVAYIALDTFAPAVPGRRVAMRAAA